MDLELPRISKKLPKVLQLPSGITLESLYQINNQSIWFLVWILKKEQFWSYIIREALEIPFTMKRGYLPNGQKLFLKIKKNNRLHSFHRCWHENGQLRGEIYWKDGHQDGIDHGWYENGQLQWESHWKNGKQVGIQRHWYENGQLEQEFNWKNGEADGIVKSWHQNGQLILEEHWKDGKVDGIVKWWNENGQLIREELWKDGNPI